MSNDILDRIDEDVRWGLANTNEIHAGDEIRKLRALLGAERAAWARERKTFRAAYNEAVARLDERPPAGGESAA